MKKLKDFEREVMLRSVSYQLEALGRFDERPDLQGARAWSESLSAHVGRSLDVHGLCITVADLIRQGACDVSRVLELSRQ